MLRDKVYKEFIEVREVFLLFNGLVGVNGGGGLGRRARGSHFKEKIKERLKVYLFFCLFMFSEQNHLISLLACGTATIPCLKVCWFRVGCRIVACAVGL